MRNVKRSWYFCGAAALSIGGTLSLSLARAAETDAAAGGELQEVVVTAERVEASAQRTAISMEVLNSDAIKSAGIATITQLSTVSPSVNVTGFGGGTVVTIRGISSRDTTEIGDPAVVVSYDGFYQDRSYALGLAQYDMERIEILRGPQGTLYGRNATGGAINIYTTRPGKEKGGYIQLEGGDYDTLNGEGAINMPVNDQVSLRASFGLQYHAPYRTDGGLYDGVDDANSRSLRLQAQFEPNEKFTARITGQHTVQTALGSQTQQAPYRIDANGWVLHNALPTLSNPMTYQKYWFSRLNLNDTMVRYDMAYKASWATFTYLGGYDRLNWNSIAPSVSFLLGPATATTPIPTSRVQAYNQTELPLTINQEVRLTSANPDSRLQWQVGAYYFRNHNDLDSYNFAPNGTPPAGSITAQPVIHFVYDVTIKSLAEMAQASFKFTDQFKVTAGIRHNKDDKTRVGYIFFAPTLPPGSVPTISPGSSANKNTYSFGLDYQVTPTSLLYAKYGTGYKAGGFTDIAEYGPESIKTTEIGSKNRFFNNRLEANFALYKSDYTGQQVQQIVQGGGGLRIVNAGATRYRGAEGDLTWVVANNSRIEFNFAYLDAVFTDFKIPNATPRWNGTAWVSTTATTASSPDFGPHAVLDTLGNVQLAGNSPQQAPKWTFGGALEQTVHTGGGAFTVRLSAKYQSEQFYSFFNRPDDRQKPYTLTNLLLTYQPNDSGFRYQAYANNLTDETVFSNAGPNDRNFEYVYSYLPPRTMGARVFYKW